MFCRFLFVLFSTFTLIACDLEDSQDNQSLEDLYGSWEYQNNNGDSFLFITKDSYTHYDYLDTYNCYTTRESQFSETTNSRLTFEPFNGLQAYLDWTVKDDVLTFHSSDGITSTLVRSNKVPSSTQSCANPDDTGEIHISVSFQNLPDSISVNHEISQPYSAEYYFHLIFDINGNHLYDEGDITVSIAHGSLKAIGPTDISLSSLNAYTVLTTDLDPTDGIDSAALAISTISKIEDTLTFTIKKSEHIAYSTLSNNANIQLYVSYVDASGGYQSDSFPDPSSEGRYDLFTPPGIDLSSITDNTNDTWGNTDIPIIVDIEEISIHFVD